MDQYTLEKAKVLTGRQVVIIRRFVFRNFFNESNMNLPIHSPAKRREEPEKEISEINKEIDKEFEELENEVEKKHAIRNFSEESNIISSTSSPSRIMEGIEEEISETTRKALQKMQRRWKIVDSDQDLMPSSDDENRKRKKGKGINSKEEDIVSNSKKEETVK